MPLRNGSRKAPPFVSWQKNIGSPVLPYPGWSMVALYVRKVMHTSRNSPLLWRRPLKTGARS